MVAIKIINDEIETPYLAVAVEHFGKEKVILRGGEGMFLDANELHPVIITKIPNVDIYV
jgi:hypothetical protein